MMPCPRHFRAACLRQTVLKDFQLLQILHLYKKNNLRSYCEISSVAPPFVTGRLYLLVVVSREPLSQVVRGLGTRARPRVYQWPGSRQLESVYQLIPVPLATKG